MEVTTFATHAVPAPNLTVWVPLTENDWPSPAILVHVAPVAGTGAGSGAGAGVGASAGLGVGVGSLAPPERYADTGEFA